MDFVYFRSDRANSNINMDEHALDDVIDWDYVIPAVGDFRELALAIHTGIPSSNIVWGSTQDSRDTTSVSEGASA